MTTKIVPYCQRVFKGHNTCGSTESTARKYLNKHKIYLSLPKIAEAINNLKQGKINMNLIIWQLF